MEDNVDKSDEGPSCPESSAENTDTRLWPIVSDEQWPDTLHITAQGALGINCGGFVIVKPIKDWHSQEKRIAELEAALSRVVRAYDDYNQARTADFHNPECGCLQCAVDNAEALTKDPLMEGKVMRTKEG